MRASGLVPWNGWVPAVGAIGVAASIALTAATSPQQPATADAPIVFGVVIVTELPLEEETSASVVEDPATYASVPGLRVIELPPVPSRGVPIATLLQNFVVELGAGGERQPAATPVTWKPRAGAPMNVRIFDRQRGDAAVATATIPAATATAAGARDDRPATTSATSDADISMPPVASAGAVQVIHGAPSGDARTMTLTVDAAPVRIIAAKPGALFWKVPSALAPGPHVVSLTTGPRARPVQMPMNVIALAMSADQTQLLKGQSTQMHVAVSGLANLPASAWQSGPAIADLVNPALLQQRAPDFKPPKPSEPGVLLLVLENRSPSVIRMGRGERIVLQIRQRDAASGTYTYDSRLQSVQAGTIDIRGTVTPFLKPVIAQPLR